LSDLPPTTVSLRFYRACIPRPGFHLCRTLCLRGKFCSPPHRPHSIAFDRLL
ncbi:hypothetical protein POSPLADRAFT_1039783, partial [Postia placenta MAD-698-R-SB12]